MSSVHDGHRQRMKQQFAEHGGEGMNDIQFLEMLLYYAIPRSDTNELAHALLKRYGTIRGVLDAELSDLRQIEGIGSTAAGHPLLRKAMNTFFCRTDRPVRFQGSINEDVSMYVLAGLRGRLVLTLTSAMIVQMVTQTNEGGMTGTYLDGGTYLKSFYSVMAAPSCVRISMLHGGTKDTAQHWRIHHHVKWGNCAAKIISAKWRKGK